jgi:Rhodopirellula transposase DDE domain
LLGEVRAAGRGGKVAVAGITGLALSTIGHGLRDLDVPLPKGRVRAEGGGRQRLSIKAPTLIADLERVVAPATLGCPMRPLLWVSKSHDKLAVEMRKLGHQISATSVKRLLTAIGFSRQSNRKADEGSKHPDRNAQFEHINAKVVAAQTAGQPVISVDTKKKELVGNYKNGGTDYRPKGDPQRVKVHDFEDKQLGKAVPYGVYDIGANAGWVSVGITSDTAQFAVASIRGWLDRMGHARYPKATKLTITADGGGSNGSRVRLWKVELQKLADVADLLARSGGQKRPLAVGRVGRALRRVAGRLGHRDHGAQVIGVLAEDGGRARGGHPLHAGYRIRDPHSRRRDLRVPIVRAPFSEGVNRHARMSRSRRSPASRRVQDT